MQHWKDTLPPAQRERWDAVAARAAAVRGAEDAAEDARRAYAAEVAVPVPAA